MIIYDFDVEDEINKIELSLKNVSTLKNNFADNITAYREFSNDICLDYNVLRDCIDSYEKSLLIDVYTFAEQIVKNFYYELLDKERLDNEYMKRFLNKKIPAEKFSPNVDYREMEKAIRNDLFPEFRFILKSDRDEILKYNEVIQGRHRYAHRGIYQLTLEHYSDVIEVDKFIAKELQMIVEHGMEYRIAYQDAWKVVKNQLEKCKKMYDEYLKNKNSELKKKMVTEVGEMRQITKRFIGSYSVHIRDCELMLEVFQRIQEFNSIDLRQPVSLKTISELHNSFVSMKLAV